MAVERIDYSTSNEYKQALQAEEQECYNQFNNEPNVAPCCFCGEPCYEVRGDRLDHCNKCSEMWAKINKPNEPIKEEEENQYPIMPF